MGSFKFPRGAESDISCDSEGFSRVSLRCRVISMHPLEPVIKQFVGAIQARHGHFNLGSPIGQSGDYLRTCTGFKGGRGDHCILFTEILWSSYD